MSRASDTYKPPSNMHGHQRTLNSNHSLERKEIVSNATFLYGSALFDVVGLGERRFYSHR